MTRQAYAGTRPRFLWLAAFSAVGLFACATGDNSSGTGGKSGGNTGGTNGGGTGGTNGGGTGGKGTGGTNGGTGGTNGGTGGTNGGTGGSNGGTGGRATGGMTGSTGGMTGGTGGMVGGCANTDMNVLNEDSSGYVCNNTFGIKGAWYCYTDGSDSTSSCKGSDGKGAGAIPWNPTAGAMCLSGMMGAANPNNNPAKFAGIGFKVNSGPPGSTAAPGTFDASRLVGFAITLVSGPSGMGTKGMVLNLEYPTPTDMSSTGDAAGVTVPGVAGTSITYNALFADAVIANTSSLPNGVDPTRLVDPTKLTDVKIAFFPDSIAHSYDFCIKSVVPLMAAPPPIATGPYGPSWTNQTAQAVNGINGYAVQSDPFPMNGNPMTMQVNVTAGGVGFTYNAGFTSPSNTPGSFPAIISGWGPGVLGPQFYGPYKGGKTIGGAGNALTSVKSNWTFTEGSSGDAVYDVWFGNSAHPLAPQIELMIWMGNKDKSPIGAAVPNASLTGSDGVSRVPYTGTNGTQQNVVSYWIPQGTQGNAANFDLLPYFKDAASHGYAGLSSGSFLLGVQTGFEVYSGNWTTTNYNISIQ